MRALVTGVAGFVGSHLAEHLVQQGWLVRGVDCFTNYYDPRSKWQNLSGLLAGSGERQFELVPADLRTADPLRFLADVDVVFHQAGQPGVRLSWSEGFREYAEHNVVVTQRLLEAAKASRVRRFVYASSSSVYGNAPAYPTSEEDLPRPHSPYGVTKLAAEHLCSLYAANWDVPVVSLRYFTVYGPRQRPDMALHRFTEAVLDGRPVPIFGDGSALRDFTYVHDVVRANVAAASRDCPPGAVINVAGGGATSVLDLVGMVGQACGREIAFEWLAPQPGDVRVTGGRTARAADLLGWAPVTSLESGISQQVEWHQRRRVEASIRIPYPSSPIDFVARAP